MSMDLLLVADPQTEKWTEAGFPARPLRSGEEMRAAFARSASRRRPAIWIVRRTAQLRALTDQSRLLRANHRLLLLQEAEGPLRDFLHLIFRVVVAPGSGVHLLPLEELKAVLAAPNRADVFVGGLLDPSSEVVVLYRGTLEPLAVPFAWFRRRAAAPVPHFHDFAVTDFGQTVRFGEYEASADVVLYAHDADYRRRAKQRALEHDDSFGASVRRLRLLKGVSRDDFPEISEKQIARIERGEIGRPHRKTVERIAERLGVSPSEIRSY